MYKPLLIIKAGATFPAVARTQGDFEDWIQKGMGDTGLPLSVVDARAEPLPPPAALAGAVITGSHAMVSDREAWSEALAGWVRQAIAAELPLLGICYGHQLLAHALGGEAGYHPGGIEIGTTTIRRTAAADGDPLFASLPPEFRAQVVHRQSVRRLPPDAVVLAANAFEPHQAFRVGRAAWGVQFHPEFSQAAIAAYIRELGADLAREGIDTEALLAALGPTAEAAALLPRFGALVRERKLLPA